MSNMVSSSLLAFCLTLSRRRPRPGGSRKRWFAQKKGVWNSQSQEMLGALSARKFQTSFFWAKRRLAQEGRNLVFRSPFVDVTLASTRAWGQGHAPDEQASPCRNRRRRLRRLACRQAVEARARACDAGGPPQLPPLSAAALPGRDRSTLAGEHRRTAASHSEAAKEYPGASRRGH